MSQFQPPYQQEPPLPQYQQQPHTGYPQWQQPPQPWYPPSPQAYEYPTQQPSMPSAQPPKRPARKNTRKEWLFATLAVLVILVLLLLLSHWLGGASLPGSGTPHNAGMSEQQYKDSTTDITVTNLDKDGNNDSGKDVHVIATILNFVKDSSGNTAGANIFDPDVIGSIIQVEFPAGTDVSQVNTQDVIEVWGTDDGTATGTNAFGATVHEVAISALYMTDRITGYSVG